MQPFDYGNVHKFKVSLGILMSASPIGIFWTLGKSSEILEIKEEDIAQLTETAQHAIDQRQSAIDFAQGWPLWGLAVVIVISGVLFVLSGISGWSKMQSVSDESDSIDLDKKKKNIQIGKSSEEEIEQKEQEELAGGTGGSGPSDVGAVVESASVAAELVKPPVANITASSDSENLHEARKGEIGEERKEILDRSVGNDDIKNIPVGCAEARPYTPAIPTRIYERLLADKLRTAYGSHFEITQDAWMKEGSKSKVYFDCLLDPLPGKSFGQLAFELKYIQNPGLSLGNVRSAIMRMAKVGQLLTGGTVYTGRRGRPPIAKVSGIVLCVVEDGGEIIPESERGKIRRISEEIYNSNETLKNPVGAVVISAREFEEISGLEWMDIISNVWSGNAVSILTEGVTQEVF